MATTRTSLRARERARQTAAVSRVRSVDVDVDVPPQLPSLVEHEIRDRERAQRLPNGLDLDVEMLSPARLGGQQARNDYPDHRVTSTDRIGGKWRTASTHRSPFVSAKNEPL